MAKTQDASKRLMAFYIDEEDARRVEKICADRGITKTQFFCGIISQAVAHVELTDADLEVVNREIQKRIEKGYPKNYDSHSRYVRS